MMKYSDDLKCKAALSLCLFTVFSILACSPEEEQDKHVGTWKMYAVIQNGEDVIKDHDPYSERRLVLNKDLSFTSSGRPFGSNTGHYSLSDNKDTLSLDSDVEDDDSQWLLTIDGDTMTWQGFGTEWAEQFRLVQVRVE